MTISHEQFRGHQPEMVPRKLLHTTDAHHPAVRDEARRRSTDFQLRLADQITAFAGSMNFVWS
jgi:uncharacterized membrane protein